MFAGSFGFFFAPDVLIECFIKSEKILKSVVVRDKKLLNTQYVTVKGEIIAGLNNCVFPDIWVFKH